MEIKLEEELALLGRPLLVKYREAWGILRMGKTTFQAEVSQGHIPVTETPAGPRISVDDLRAYVAKLPRRRPGDAA